MRRMSRSHYETVNKWQFFGLKFYEKIRVNEYLLPSNFSFQIEKNLYPGILFLHSYPQIESGNRQILDIDWERTASAIYLDEIFYLIARGNTELWRYSIKKKFLFGLISIRSKEFHLKLNEYFSTSDVFLNGLQNQILAVNRLPKYKHNIHYLVKLLNDLYLGESAEHNYPENTFVKSVLRTYDSKFGWFKLNVKRKMFGLSESYTLELDPQKGFSLRNQFTLFNHCIIEIKRSHEEYQDFENKLESELRSDFRRRTPSNDNFDD